MLVLSQERAERTRWKDLLASHLSFHFRCHQMDDFGPAKNLMTMCFTYYHIGETRGAAYVAGRPVTFQRHVKWAFLKAELRGIQQTKGADIRAGTRRRETPRAGGEGRSTAWVRRLTALARRTRESRHTGRTLQGRCRTSSHVLAKCDTGSAVDGGDLEQPGAWGRARGPGASWCIAAGGLPVLSSLGCDHWRSFRPP